MKYVNRIVLMGCAAVGLAVPQMAAAKYQSAEQVDEATEKKEKKKATKITDRRHPQYVRCRSEPIIGSLSRKRRLCMTNQQWANYKKTGSRDSRQFVEDSQPGFMMTPN